MIAKLELEITDGVSVSLESSLALAFGGGHFGQYL
jgi:hypothetical protein